MKVILGAMLLFGALALVPAHSQQVALVQGQIIGESGTPVAQQPVLIEGQPKRLKLWSWLLSEKPVSVIAVTDTKGFFQVVDLPPGQYKVKLWPTGGEPITIAEFKLGSGYGTFTFSEMLRVKKDMSEELKLREELWMEKR